jgi:hypothetical protein
MRITPCALVTPPWPCRRPCAATAQSPLAQGGAAAICGMHSAACSMDCESMFSVCPRHGLPAAGELAGATRGDEPEPPVAAAGQAASSARPAGSHLRLVHRGLRHCPTSGRLKHYLPHWERRKATIYNSVVCVSAVNPNAWSGRQCRRREAAPTAQPPSICRAVVKAALARAPSVATKPPACQPVGAPVPVVAGSVLCPGAPVQPAGAPVQPAGAPVQPVPCRSK